MHIIEKCINLKHELDQLRPISKDDELRIMQKFRLNWNYHSNHLEGNSLTYGETKFLLLYGNTAGNKPLKDFVEMKGHNEVIKWIEEVVKQKRPLTETFIRSIHELLLKEPYEVDAITPDGKPTKKLIKVGDYKETANHVTTKTGEIFRFATVEETPAKMMDLIKWYRSESEKKDLEPILLASEFHYKFIRIHPFDDGNGRTARILMNFILMSYGYPPVIIRTEEKENYYSVLRQADADIFSPFVEYIAKNLYISLEIMISGAKGEDVEDTDDIDKEIALLKQFVLRNKDVKIRKSENSVLDVFKKSFIRLLTKFVKKSGLMKDFYLDTDILIFVNLGLSSSDSHLLEIEKPKLFNLKNILQIEKYIIENGLPEEVTIQYYYKIFSQKGFDDFNFASNIKFVFNLTNYIVEVDNGVSISKYYGDNLTPDEKDQIINSEIRRHKDFIEQKIKESKTKQSKK